MIKVIVTDDESHCVETMQMLLKEYCPEVTIIHTCRNALETLEAINKTPPDLLFLDIEMPGMNGFQMLEKLPAIPFPIVFTTGYDQYAIKTIKFSALDYLLKPVDPEELIIAVKKVAERRLPFAEQFQLLMDHTLQKNHQFKKIAIPTFDGFELIPPDDIVRCEAKDNYTYLFLKNRNKIVASRTLKEVEEQLSYFKTFIRVHHSYVVNLNEIKTYTKGEGGFLTMSDGVIVNVSRRKKEALMKWL